MDSFDGPRLRRSLRATAATVRAEVNTRCTAAECHLATVTAAIGAHTGPGEWGVYYQIEDSPIR